MAYYWNFGQNRPTYAQSWGQYPPAAEPFKDQLPEEPSFDDAFDAETNMKLRLQQGQAPPAAESITAGRRSADRFHGWRMPVMPDIQNTDFFAAARQQNGAPRRRTCNEIFRNIHAHSREQFRGSPYKTMARPHSQRFDPWARAMEEQAMEEQAMDEWQMDQFTAPRRLGITPRERFRGGHSYASRGGPNGGARAYGGLQNLQNVSSMYPDAPDLAPSVQDMFTVIHPSLKQAGQQPKAFKGPTALRRLM